MCDLANLSGVIRDTLSRGSFYTQTGTLHLTLHHFTPQKGYFLHHVNRALLWLRINVFVSHSAASLFLSTKSVKLPLLHLKIYFTGFDALMSFAGFVLKEAFWSSACLPNTYAWGKWSGRSRGCVAWLRFGPDEDGRCVIGLWNRLCIVFLGSMSWCWINTFLLQDQNLDRFLYIYIHINMSPGLLNISSLNVYPFAEKIKEEMQFVTTASHFCSLFTNMLWHSPYLIKENGNNQQAV